MDSDMDSGNESGFSEKPSKLERASSYGGISEKQRDHEWDRNPRSVGLLDFESFFLVVFLVIGSVVINSFIRSLAAALIAAAVGVSLVILVGYKLSQLIITRLFKPSRSLTLAFATFLGPGFIYVMWISISSFSSYAPLVTVFASFLLSLAPPKLGIRRYVRREFKQIRLNPSEIRLFVLFAVQVGLMSLVSWHMAAIPVSGWIHSIFEGISWIALIAIAAVFFITVYLTTKKSTLWLLSLLVVTFWTKSFMLIRGFIHFGGDNGVNVAIVQYLTDGGHASFIWSSEMGWRSGSLASLFYQSFGAFLCVLTGLTPSYAAGAISIAVTAPFLVFGAYSLAPILLRNQERRRLATVIMVQLVSALFWWQFTFTPNSLMHCLLFSYMTLVLLLPKSRSGTVCFLLASLTIWWAHPTAIALAIPATTYYFFRVMRKRVHRIHPKKVILGLTTILAGFVLLILDPTIRNVILTTLYLGGVTGPDARHPITIGNKFWSSMLVRNFLQLYCLPLVFAAVGLCLVIRARSEMKNAYTGKIVGFAFMSTAFLFGLAFLDFAVQSIVIPAWRLWPVALSFLVVISVPGYSTAAFPGKRCRRIVSWYTRNRITSNNLAAIALSVLITVSFFLGAYPGEQNVNMDTNTGQEYKLLEALLKSIDLNDSIIMAEQPTWRYIQGMIHDWPLTQPTFHARIPNPPGKVSGSYRTEVIRAFVSLAYYDNPAGISQLLIEQNVQSVYFVVFNRYAGEKGDMWYQGKPYPQRLRSIGHMYLEQEAGYVIRFDRTDYIHISLDEWELAWKQPDNGSIEVVNDTLLLWAEFTGRLQSVAGCLNFTLEECEGMQGFYIRYNSDNHSGAPVMRMWLTYANGTSIETAPFVFPSLTTITYYYNMGGISLEYLSSITLSIDSGSDVLPWQDPGYYYYRIYDIYVAPW